MNSADCPVCAAPSELLDVVDFNKSCEEAKGQKLPLSGIPIYYSICSRCAFCWAPDIYKWSKFRFQEMIYNDDYIKVDPDYLESRPRTNAEMLISAFPAFSKNFRHLDYGGGNGTLSLILRNAKWDSISYDPFVDDTKDIIYNSRFDLVTAFEVFEHVPDVRGLLADLSKATAENGLVLFSTLLSDQNISINQRLGWWYAAPRNGHISIFSGASLSYLGHQFGFLFGSFSPGLHFFCRNVPIWASHLIKVG